MFFFASAISMNQICIYLSSKNLVNTILDKHLSIAIPNTTLEIRPLRAKFWRVVSSNISPIILQQILEQEIKLINVRTGSSTRFFKLVSAKRVMLTN